MDPKQCVKELVAEEKLTKEAGIILVGFVYLQAIQEGPDKMMPGMLEDVFSFKLVDRFCQALSRCVRSGEMGSVRQSLT